MNMFWFHPNQSLNVQQHCDKHIVKMPLELAQMLSCAHYVHNSPLSQHLYKPTHRNHPCTVWICSSKQAYDMAFSMYTHLLREYTFRYGKYHKSGSLWDDLANNPCPDGELLPIPLAMPEQYKHSCPFKSYQHYFNGEKRHIAQWSNRPAPEWWENSNDNAN
jgi:hypothetical protein